MARYILIDAYTGYVWGDTADINGAIANVDNPKDAARAIDESVGAYGRTYEMAERSEVATRGGYFVYRADVGGSEAVHVVHDGQDQETIQAVMDNCEYVCSILTEMTPDA